MIATIIHFLMTVLVWSSLIVGAFNIGSFILGYLLRAFMRHIGGWAIVIKYAIYREEFKLWLSMYEKKEAEDER